MECPVCGTANPPVARFCLNCGSQLPNGETPARHEERKVVSVLFADLVGFTARAEQLDPEDVERILGPYHERLRSELERHGGTVEKFIGDAVMAVFGAPTVRENDAERAVRAALAIRDWSRAERDVELRIAVNSGEALVSLDARAERGQALVKGDVVNTAARLQAAAPVNGVLVGEATYQATRHVIDYRPAEPVAAKGKAQPVRAWEAEQARSHFGVDVRHIGRAALVGRQREVAVLRDALARVIDTRQPQLVTLVAVPGMGKSRLVWELFRELDSRQDVFLWRQGRSLPYGEGVSFWALGEIVKAQAGILESDSPQVAADKLDRSVASLLGESAQRDWVSSHLRPLVGLEHEALLAPRQQGEAFAAWRRYLEAIAEEHPLVLVFEDLHWADEALLDFVDHLAEWASAVPLLMLATARPELLARRPGWGGGKTNALTLSLPPLSEEETAELVHDLFGSAVLPAEIQQTLIERSAGNPLYAEEFVRLMSEGSADAVPASVQAIVAARLDALEPDDKQLLQRAAVLGKVFWLGALADVSGRSRWSVEDALHRLERREFVRREQRSSVAAETEYAFRHALVRDAAYEQLPRAQRGEQHRRVARWLESLARPDDTAEMLAHHYLAALEYARAAGQPVDDLVEPARLSFGAAGERALALNAFAGARRLYEAALSLTSEQDPSRGLLLLAYGRTLERSDHTAARPVLSEASIELERQGQPERAAEAEVMIAQLDWHAGDRPAADQHLARAERLVAKAGTAPSRARVLSELSRYHMLASRTRQAIDLGREAIRLAQELALPEVEAHALNNVGSARFFAGDAGGLDEIERAVELAESIDSPEAARAYNNLAAAISMQGDLQRSQALRAQAVETDRKYGGEAIARFAEGALITGLFLLGRWDEFMEQSDRFAADSARLGRSYQELYHLSERAIIAVSREQDDVALATAGRAAAWAREVREPQVVVPALSALAYVSFELGMSERGRQALAELAELAPRHMLYDWLFAAGTTAPDAESRSVLFGTALRNTGSKLERTIGDLRDGRFVQAAEALQQTGWQTYAAMARTKAAAELAAKGRYGEAETQARLALAFWHKVRASRYISRTEELLKKSA